jgi:hypothetical protein
MVEVGQSNSESHIRQLGQIFLGFKKSKKFNEPRIFTGFDGIKVYHQNNCQGIGIQIQCIKKFTKFQSSSVTSSQTDGNQMFEYGQK